MAERRFRTTIELPVQLRVTCIYEGITSLVDAVSFFIAERK